MRWLLFSVCFLVLGGCAQVQVRERSTNYSYTFSDMEDRIVLENIARFIDDRDRLPSMADFKQGQVQGTDNVNLGATLPFTRGLSGVNVIKNPAVLNIGAVQTQSQDNWTYVPVTDVDDLVRTRCLYKYVILQFEQPDFHRTQKHWKEYSQSQCSLGDHTPVFGYAPPYEPWLVWRPANDAAAYPEGSTDERGRQIVYFGTFRSHDLWGVSKSFHDFQLALLGSIPNTAGSSAAGTSPAAAKPVVDTGQLVLKAALTSTSQNFHQAGETLNIRFTLINTTQKAADAPKLVSTRFKLTNEGCLPASLVPNVPANDCTATTVTTADDVAKGSIDDLTTAYATDAAGSILSSAVSTKILVQGAPKISPQTQLPTSFTIAPNTLKGFQSIYPSFNPGKSSGPVAAPPVAPPQ